MACSIVKKDIKNAFLKLLGNNLKRPYEKYVGWKYLKLTFCHNSIFLIPISLQPNCV